MMVKIKSWKEGPFWFAKASYWLSTEPIPTTIDTYFPRLSRKKVEKVILRKAEKGLKYSKKVQESTREINITLGSKNDEI